VCKKLLFTKLIIYTENEKPSKLRNHPLSSSCMRNFGDSEGISKPLSTENSIALKQSQGQCVAADLLVQDQYEYIDLDY